ncbi:MAG: hypothetical protein GY711_03985 [bacterium]|nr:hypothetical protein [bacterium]
MIRAEIDGLSQLILDDDTAQWHHISFAAPGRHFCDSGDPIEPTILGGVEWFPVWPDVPDCENRDCNQYGYEHTPADDDPPREP